jgi:hypothetical protein
MGGIRQAAGADAKVKCSLNRSSTTFTRRKALGWMYSQARAAGFDMDGFGARMKARREALLAEFKANGPSKETCAFADHTLEQGELRREGPSLSGSRECLIRLLTSKDQLKLEREPMKCILTAAIAFGVLSSGAAFSQINPSTTSPIPPAVSTSDVDSKTSAAPVAGANSFTQSQAKKRIEAHGYSDVMELTKDDNSIWRGKAVKGGKQVSVALDYQRNIVRY